MKSNEELLELINKLEKRIEAIESIISTLQPYKDNREIDELYSEAESLVKRYDSVSSSMLQRRLAIGYARAARLLDMMEEKGIIGIGEGARPRKVLIHS